METTPVGLAELARILDEEPTSFEFFEAVRVLERLAPQRTPVGGFGNPDDEVVRFAVTPSMAFPPSEIRSLERSPGAAARMVINFLGLTGPQGVLPLHYTQLVAERTRVRDTALRDFLDLFHHRILSLFYRAWARHRVMPTRADGGEPDAVATHLFDLLGLGTPELTSRLPLAPDTLLFYTGLLSLQTRSAIALQELLEDYFGAPVEVEQFVGGWYPLEQQTQCELGNGLGASAQLGLGAVVGDEIWDQQARVRIRIGPLSRERYEEFLPNGSAFPTLKAITEFFSGGQFDFEVQLILSREEVSPCVLGADTEPAPLGWSTWLRTAPLTRDPDDLVLTL